jgi:hypothetical protein
VFKYLLILAIGVAGGYSLGWKDAKTHEEGIVTRVVDRIGGSSREKYRTDVDAQMERLEKK